VSGANSFSNRVRPTVFVNVFAKIFPNGNIGSLYRAFYRKSSRTVTICLKNKKSILYSSRTVITIAETAMEKMALKTSNEIGTLIRKLRKQQGVTQEQLAGIANTGTRFISDLENGKPTCQVGKLLRALAALGVEMHIRNPYDKGQ
jgi:y4mF family transcriptional regulator